MPTRFLILRDTACAPLPQHWWPNYSEALVWGTDLLGPEQPSCTSRFLQKSSLLLKVFKGEHNWKAMEKGQ
jgi:hypothetical protein